MSATTAIISPLGSSATIVLSAEITNNFTTGQCRVTGQAAGLPERNAFFGCHFTTGAAVQAFTMSVSPTTLTMGRNAAAALTVNIARKNSFMSLALFSVEGLPSGATWNTPGIPYNSTTGTINIGTKSSTPVGTYLLTVKGTTGTAQYLTERQTVQLVVR
jgi:hypothetical protein